MSVSKKIKSIKNSVLNSIHNIHSIFALCALNFRNYSDNVLSNDPNIIVSLTSFHKRFDQLHLTIRSILTQKFSAPYSVHLILSKADIDIAGGVPKEIMALEKYGLKIIVVNEDLRSYKKLHYTLKDYPEKIIVTADDDVLYPKNWLTGLYEKWRKYPSCVVCYRGHFLAFKKSGEFYPYAQLMKNPMKLKRSTPSFALMPTGVSGVLYPPGLLSDFATREELFTEYAPFADDIWYKLSSLATDTKCVQVKFYNVHFPHLRGSQDNALNKMNVAQSLNDEQLKKCYKVFPEILDKIKLKI
ncbi:hypothetical protein ACIKP9_00410 [Methylobacillus methanolivorans]|uniref:Glycosyltransferase 2-like domain-containing protein n=1 Tax=Methylobacillus methanolivorans TaxID=1848927 RepID=A0ABW8GH32_9PROT